MDSAPQLRGSSYARVSVRLLLTVALLLSCDAPSPLEETPNRGPTVELISPASGTNLPLRQPVMLRALVSDTDGRVTSVRFYHGSVALGSDSDAPFELEWTPETVGNHQLHAIATDNDDATTTSAVITVTVTNAAPTVGISSPTAGATLALNQAVAVMANATDPDGVVVEVRFFAGTQQLGIDSIAPYSVNWTPSAVGDYTLLARATDSDGATTNSGPLTVTVINAAPTIAITSPATGAVVPLNVPLSITASGQDPDGSIVEVRFYDGAAQLGVDSTAPYGVNWTFVTAGPRTLTARAVDDLGAATTSAPVHVVVSNTAPSVAITAPANGAVLQRGVAATIAAAAADPDGAVVEVRFFAGGTLLGVDSSAPYALNWTPAGVGSFALTARATDNAGVTTTSAAVQVSVPNAAPTVSVTSPTAGTNLLLNQPVTVTAAASDADGNVVAVRFLDGSTLIGADSTSPYAVSWTPTVPGSRSLSARAVDNDQVESVSSTVAVLVSAAPNTAPVAIISSPASGVKYQGGDVIHLAGSGSDAEEGGLPASRLTWWADFHHDTHTHPFLADSSAASLDIAIPTLGHTESNVWYRFYLRVVDAEGVADTVFREIHPVTVNLTIASQRPGLEITLDGQPHLAPFTVTAVAGIVRTIGVTSPQSAGDSVYAFASWSDGGDSVHAITTPAVNTTYTATFTATGPANVPPTVALTSPAENSTHTISQPVALAATAGDSDGSVLRVTFFDGATAIGSDTTAPYGVSWTPSTGGPHTLTARAVDDDSAVTVSAAVHVSVTSPVSDVTPPTVQLTAPSHLDQGLTGSITISANASDNVGVTGVELQVDGVTVLDDLQAPYTTSVSTANYATGVHRVRARARDSAGNHSGWSTATVTFGGNNVLAAGFSRAILAGGNLRGSATGMSVLPDGRLLVAQQDGELRVYKNGALLNRAMLTVTVQNTGERGLLGVTPHPQFTSNRWIYIYYTTSSGGAHNRIARYTVAATGDTVETGKDTVIVELPALDGPTVHNGGALGFGPDGKLYVAVGERGNASDAPRVESAFGKMLRYNSDGSIPADNPFFGTAGAFRAVWAKGLRNPFTFSFSQSGRMFINDVGESAWEEINEGAAGADYGWPSREGPGSGGGFTYPLYAYGHSSNPVSNPTLVSGIAIVGSSFYEPTVNTFGPAYGGNYFFGDYNGEWINRLDPANENGVYAFARLGYPQVVDLKVGPDGALYVLGHTGGGWAVTRISR